MATNNEQPQGLSVKDHVRTLVALYRNENKIFHITFRRRNDKIVDGKVVAKAGELREMSCRLHVTKGVKGALPPGQRKAEDFEHQCLTVFEMGAGGGFKRIPLDAIVGFNVVESPQAHQIPTID